ncbi:tetratricopeptide repeat protein [Croceivirga sp. JEA036]|uniref:tetratricopeptide repeat protein n=1 Tax=Croceivirga sp. JEA036 TaxID=2721162 RepID=UPI0014392ADD|nr:tetratricopeptide repeat protein [Croceivirga sp. JEA036]NJB37344.1 tetratricopeptide repeat protein [Croceivirga sp. JEA036]
MKKNIYTLLLLGMGLTTIAYAQETQIYTHDNKLYQDALALYNEQQYQAAQALFYKVKESTTDQETEANSVYYVANAAIRLNQRGADKLMEDFVERYPTSTKRNSAFMDVADYYFETGKYPNALKWYKKVEQNSMSKKDKERFNFNTGYSYYASNRPDEAEKYLSKVTNSNKFGSQAKYYLGYISYEQDDYDEANQRFDQINDPEILEEKLSYYQADLNFKLGKFEEAIAMAKKQLPKSDRREVSELNKIIGESYFNLEKYDQAVPYLQEYKGKRGKWSNTDYYLLGYSFYKQGDFESAIGQFNKIINGTNSVAQNAYYHLAECYLKLDKKSEALNAFRNAASMDFNDAISKDALLNYARLSYEIGNAYEPVPQVMMSYLEKYPKDENEEEIQSLLVDSYITSKNFAGAMELLEKNPSFASDATYQKVAFYRGVELFADTDYTGSLAAFDKSLKKKENVQLAAKAQFWKAESEYRLNQFAQALGSFKAVNGSEIEEIEQLDYNLGYCYFKLKEYNKAISHFNSAATNTNLEEVIKTDALIRLGDTYFVSSNYNGAIKAYDKASSYNGPERDYAAYQVAMSNGFLGKNSEKISQLASFNTYHPKSSLRDDALFELANTYIKTNKETEGLAAYDKLVSQFSNSKFAPQALLRQGLVHYNASRNEQAINKFKHVVSEYPKSQEAVQAVSTAKQVYVDIGKVNEYAAWARNLDFVEVTDSELEEASFEAADRKYVEGKTDAAVKAFENYLKEFPNGVHAVQANFTLAQLHFSSNRKEKALVNYKNVADRGSSEYMEQALTRVCEIYVGKGDYASAMPYLKQLETVAEISQNRVFAQSNLMKGYYDKKEYQQTLVYAEKVLQAPNLDDRIRSDAKIMIARSAIETGDMQLAEQAFSEVKEIATGRAGAEAWYYDAYFKRQDNNYEDSNVSVQKLVKDFSSYKEWGGKGLLLMAKNFYALEDAFQATYILESVQENFSEFPELVAEAKGELALIKSQEAQRNSSVNPNGK